MTNTTASIIREARQLITPPEAWTQGALARHENGNVIVPQDENASCFCIVGAIGRVANDPAQKWDTIRRLIPLCSPYGITQFNDTHTHEEVLALLDKAALAAEDAA